MPEEINRIMCDHASTLLFSPTLTGYRNLLREGFSAQNQPPFTSDNPGVFHCGDIMFDNSLYFASIAEERSDVLKQWGLENGDYLLATIHRDNNTDIPERLQGIFSALIKVSTEHNVSIALPLHPRTSGLLKQNLPAGLYEAVTGNPFIKIMPPVSFLDMIKLEKHARIVITDSGGVQKEAYYFGKPCIIARPETEWVEIVEAGAGTIADANEEAIVSAATGYLNYPPVDFPEVFGDGNAAEFICRTIIGSAGL
jgi:UDP-GlcNAc3NAcA epimerase